MSRDPADGRVTLAQLTRLGTRRLKKAHELLAAEEFGLAGLDETEKADLTALLLKVRVSHGDLRHT
jgi:DNA-binding MarR family transcriptional regulator